LKIALCFYGLVGSASDKNGTGIELEPKIAGELYRKHIIDCNEGVDVFIHSSSMSKKRELVDFYRPKNYLIESQVDFNSGHMFRELNLNFKEKVSMSINALFHKCSMKQAKKNITIENSRALSRWYSTKKVLELMSKYELDNNFEYDFVLLTRLDVGFFTDINFNKLDKDYFYVSHWNDPEKTSENLKANKKNHHKGKGFLDFWFISNSKNMKQFSLLFDNVDNYHRNPHKAAYQHAKSITNNIQYILYRWFDHEMIRRKFFGSEK